MRLNGAWNIVGYTFGNHVLRLHSPRHRKTKFPTVYLTIYPPKLKFWIQLCPKYMADLFHLFAYWCLLLTTFANNTFWTQIRPNKMLGLIWIQNVWHSDDIPDFFNFFLEKVDFGKKSTYNKNASKISQHASLKSTRKEGFKYQWLEVREVITKYRAVSKL